MQVSEAIGSEAIFFLYSLLEGIGLIFVYDIFRILRRIIRHGTVWIGIEDVVYWIFCTIAVFLLLYQKNDGMMRAFSFLGILCGMAFYYFLFSRFVIKICVFFFGGILRIFSRTVHFFLKPFSGTGKKTFLFLKKELKKIYKTIRMCLCKR